jgi:hypothetical protein
MAGGIPLNLESAIAAMRSAMQGGDWQAAMTTAQLVLDQGGSDWRIRLNLGVCACRAHQGPGETWLEHVELALKQSNQHDVAKLGAAEVNLTLGNWERVLDLLSSVQRPQTWVAFQLSAAALGRLGRTSEGLALLAGWPENKRTWQWRMAVADLNVQAGDWTAAEQEYRAVLAERPQQAEAHINHALTLLSQRRCTEAWPHYEWRRTNPRLNDKGIPEPLPSLGSLKNKHVVLQGEQGIGDQIMASRYIQPLAGMCRSVSVEPAARLSKLLRRNLPEHIAVGPATDRPKDAVVIGTASLPLLFWKTHGVAIPKGGYTLRADPQSVATWRSRLNALPPGQKIGIAWLGGSTSAEHRERALKTVDLMRLRAWPGVQWVDLQFLPRDGRRLAEQSRQAGLHRMGDPGLDLDDTLALIECLDGVITTRQTVAHLTGALGKSGQVLVPARPEWRYWGEDNRWAWYPSMKLLHQQLRGDWGPALDEAARHWLDRP